MRSRLLHRIYAFFGEVQQRNLLGREQGQPPKGADAACGFRARRSGGRCAGDGFFGVPDSVGEVLIAGMGGSEILSILTDEKHGFLPKTFVFQPMLNADKLRAWLLENGAYITRDFTFKDGKFYDVICGRRREAGEAKQVYSEMEIEFGRENLATFPEAFLERTRKQLSDVERFLATDGLQEGSRAELLMRKAKLEAVLTMANETE